MNFEINSLGDEEDHFMVSVRFGLSHYKVVCHSLQESISTVIKFANDKGLYDADGELEFQLVKKESSK